MVYYLITIVNKPANMYALFLSLCCAVLSNNNTPKTNRIPLEPPEGEIHAISRLVDLYYKVGLLWNGTSAINSICTVYMFVATGPI